MDWVIKPEVLQDYINDTYGRYFRYFIKNNIDFDDILNPLVRKLKILNDMLYNRWKSCETDEDISEMKKRVDEPDKYFRDHT